MHIFYLLVILLSCMQAGSSCLYDCLRPLQLFQHDVFQLSGNCTSLCKKTKNSSRNLNMTLSCSEHRQKVHARVS